MSEELGTKDKNHQENNDAIQIFQSNEQNDEEENPTNRSVIWRRKSRDNGVKHHVRFLKKYKATKKQPPPPQIPKIKHERYAK